MNKDLNKDSSIEFYKKLLESRTRVKSLHTDKSVTKKPINDTIIRFNKHEESKLGLIIADNLKISSLKN